MFTAADIDRLLLDALKAVHNDGAARYNAGESAAAAHIYQGALSLAAAFLTHRPGCQRAIAEGLADVARAGGNPAVLAFRLHEVIDQVRNELKSVRDDQPAGQTDRIPQLTAAPLRGAVTAFGRPAAGVVVMLTAPGDPTATATAVADSTGRFALTALPGEYVLTLAGAGVPATASGVGTSPFRVEVPEDGGTVTVDLAYPGRVTVRPV